MMHTRRATLVLFSCLLLACKGVSRAALSGCTSPAVGADAKPARDPGPVAPPTTKAPVSTEKRLILGYNLDFPGDWSKLMPFIDLMKDARPFMGGCSDSTPGCDQFAHLDLDAQGWPKSLRFKDDPSKSYGAIETVFSTHEGVPDEGKLYAITWEGTGAFSFTGVDPVSQDLKQRRITFVFRPGNKILRIVKTDPAGSGDYVRNVKIFRLDREPLLKAGEIFNPDALDYLKPFGSVRFMDWMLSNDEETRDALWAERPRFEYAHWIRQLVDPLDPKQGVRSGGYPVEVLVALANKAGTHAHFNMPYRYTDEWVTQFATYVRDHLDPKLRATIEYSNEVWNWGFPQAGYANIEGRKLWPDEGSAWVQFMGVRAARMCELWRKAFKGQDARLRCLIAPQTAWVELADASLDCPRWVAMDPAHRKPCHKYVDAVAITGYFSGHLGEGNHDVLRSWIGKGRDFAIERALRELEHGDVPEVKHPDGKKGAENSDSLAVAIDYLKKYRAIADKRGLELYVYEGGTSMASNEADVKDLLFWVSEQERIRLMYLQLFTAAEQLGVHVFNCWGWIEPHDPWANAQTVLDRRRSKYRAISEFMRRPHP